MRIISKLLLLAVVVSGCKTTSSNESGLRNTEGFSFQKAKCLAPGRSLVMTIERSENELPFPTFNLVVTARGREYLNISDLPVISNSNSQITIGKETNIDHRQGIQVTVGVQKVGDSFSGFYQEAANDGLSPLPAVEYQECLVDGSAVSLPSPTQKTATCLLEGGVWMRAPACLPVNSDGRSVSFQGQTCSTVAMCGSR